MREQFTHLQLSLLVCLLLPACGVIGVDVNVSQHGGERSANQRAIEKSSTSKSVSAPHLGLIETDSEALNAWRKFTEDNHYRVAQADDFNFSESSNTEHYRPYGDGDFNRDNKYFDFAVIVVDTMRKDDSRFGVVIFNARREGKGYDGPFWLYCEKDLSRTSLNTTSHGPLLIAEHKTDGTVEICVVEWNQEQKKYGCDSR